MTKDDIVLLYRYDRWANDRLFKAAAALTLDRFTRGLGTGRGSVRDTLLHIVGGEWGWITYWKERLHGPTFLEDLWTRHDALFAPEAFPDWTAVQLKWAEVEMEQAEFVNGVTDESLERMFTIRTTQVSLAHLMQHLVNHSTYHRGQIAVMLRQLGAEAPATDFHLFLLEASRGK